MNEPRSLHHVLGFLILMVVMSLFFPWRESDWWLYGKLQHVDSADLSDRVVVVDVPYSARIEEFRASVAGALRALAAQPDGAPWIVLLDIVISSDERGATELMQSLQSLRDGKAKLYAVVDPTDNGRIDPDYMQRLHLGVYSLVDGVGHTVFFTRGESAAYQASLAVGAGRPALPAMTQVIAVNHLEGRARDDSEQIAVKLGRPDSFAAHTYRYTKQGFVDSLQRPIAALGDLRNRIVIVGNLERDVSTVAGRTGPELIAWTLNEHVAVALPAQPRALLAHPALLLALVLGLAVVAVAVAGLLFKLVPSAHSHLWVLPVAGAGTALLVLAGVALAAMAMRQSMPQITLVVIGVLAAATFAGMYLHRYQRWQDESSEPQAIAEEYDVFVSYSRTPENARWVDEHVMPALQAARTREGRPLRVFRDSDRIRVGDPWFRRIVHALNASRCFLAIYSTDYFQKIPCVRELERAAQKEFTTGEFLILPVSRLSHDELMRSDIFKTYDKYQYLDSSADPNFMQQVVGRVCAH